MMKLFLAILFLPITIVLLVIKAALEILFTMPLSKIR
jgi:hypothetical protein